MEAVAINRQGIMMPGKHVPVRHRPGLGGLHRALAGMIPGLAAAFVPLLR